MAEPQPDKTVIALAGGGSAAERFLMSFVRELRRNPRSFLPLKIFIANQGEESELGRGGPFSEKHIEPFHTMSLDYTPDFLGEWIEQNPARYKQLNPYPLRHGAISRVVTGEAMHFLLKDCVQFLRRNGVEVDIHNNATMNTATRVGDSHQMEVTLSDGHKEKVDYLILGTGHHLHQEPGMISPAWDAKKIAREVPADAASAVIGTSQSAVESVLTRAHLAGDFKEKGDGTLEFVPKAGAENFKVTMYSPSGQLAGVMGAIKFDERNFLEHAYQNRLRGENPGFLSLDEVFARLRDAFVYEVLPTFDGKKTPLAAPEIARLKQAMSISMTLEQAAQVADDYLSSKSPEQTLKRDIAMAKESRQTGVPLPWQSLFATQIPALGLLAAHFSAEDRERIDKYALPLVAKQAYPMILDSAEKMLALMESKTPEGSPRLDVKRLGKDFSITPAGKGCTFHYRDAAGEHTDKHDYVVDARGNLDKGLFESNPLLKAMHKEGLVQEAAVPFNDMEAGKQRVGKDTSVELRGGVPYKKTGGIQINPTTFRVVPSAFSEEAPAKGVRAESYDDKRAPAIFALGANLGNRMLEGQGILTYASGAIVKEMRQLQRVHSDMLMEQAGATPIAFMVRGNPVGTAYRQKGTTPDQERQVRGVIAGQLGINPDEVVIVDEPETVRRIREQMRARERER